MYEPPPERQITYVTYIEHTEPPWDSVNVPLGVRLLVRWLITIAGFVVAEFLVNNLFFDDDRWVMDGIGALLIATAVYVVLRAVFRPILIFLTCPLQLITLGLFMLVVNAAIVIMTEDFCDWWGIGFAIDGFWPAFWGAIVISLVSFAISRVLRRNPFGPPR